VQIDPPLRAWTLADRVGRDRSALAGCTAQHHQQLGTAALDSNKRIIATGHQPGLWHPGILAKDLAMHTAAEAHSAAPLHLIVDHDAIAALSLEVPRQTNDALHVEHLHLGPEQPAIPAGFQPPVDGEAVRDKLRRHPRAALLEPIRRAFADLPACDSLAQQMAVVLARLKRPWIGDQPVLFVSDLAKLEAFQALIEQMRAEPRRCALAYNRAVAAHPEAGVPPLAITHEWIELPLWACGWRQPRRRVFADVAGHTTLLVTPDGEPIDPRALTLLPRALTLTAVMRSALCELFIHGRGGGVYDRVTDQWWHQFTGQTLAPATVVSADVRMSFDVPSAEPRDLAAAQWHAHHLPHNLDRALALSGPLVREKRRLIDAMDRDCDPWRRGLSFRAIHHINDELQQRHPEAVQRARENLLNARQGIVNRAVLDKRDWCFALYDGPMLAQLADRITGAS
jgi:hypothetical protein